MTTGSWTTGTFPAGGTTRLHAAKSWTGDDGSEITDRFTRTNKWNFYRMAHQKFKSSNPNLIGIKNPVTGVESVQNNHSWQAGAGTPSIAIGYATFSDGTIPNTFLTSQFNSIWTAQTELALQSKLLEKIKGHQFNIGVALAEVDKLAGSVISTISDLSKGVVLLAQGKYAQFARLFGAVPPSRKTHRRLRATDVSGRFLELRYCWEPTIKDAFDACKAFEQISNGPRQIRFRKGKRVVRSSFYNTNYCRVNQAIEARRAYIFEMYEEMGVARQLGLANPLSIVWERMPYSFVIDWFIPVGTYLELIGQIPFLKGRWLRTDSIRHSSSGSYSAVRSISGWDPASPSVNCDWESFHLLRQLLASPPAVPFPNVKVAGAVHGKRVGNAIALAHQIFGSLGHVRDAEDFLNVLVDPTFQY